MVILLPEPSASGLFFPPMTIHRHGAALDPDAPTSSSTHLKTTQEPMRVGIGWPWGFARSRGSLSAMAKNSDRRRVSRIAPCVTMLEDVAALSRPMAAALKSARSPTVASDATSHVNVSSHHRQVPLSIEVSFRPTFVRERQNRESKARSIFRVNRMWPPSTSTSQWW